MQHYVIDGRRMQSSDAMHEHLKARLRLPDSYGRNLDALWDALSERAEGDIALVHASAMPEELYRFLRRVLKDLPDAWTVSICQKAEPESRLKAVIFDMDGVLVNSEPRHIRACESIVRRLSNGEHGANEVHAIGISTVGLYRGALALCGTDGDPEALKEEHFELTLQLIREEIPDPEPELIMLLDMLHAAGIRLAVASSSPRPFVEAVLEQYGILPCFEVIVTGDDVETLKPSPEIYHKTLARLELEGCDVAAVEDSRVGTTAAAAAGIYTIGFVNGDCGREDLSQADCTVDCFHLVPAALMNM